MQPGNVLMRVKEGKRPLPYNDGQQTGLHQPGEVFEGPAKYLVEFRDHVEAVGEDGEPVQVDLATMVTDGGVPLMAMRAHERVTVLQDLVERRKREHGEELERLEAQIGEEQTRAEAEAEEKRRRQAAHHAVEEAAGGHQPAAGEAQATGVGQGASQPAKPAQRAPRTSGSGAAESGPKPDVSQG